MFIYSINADQDQPDQFIGNSSTCIWQLTTECSQGRMYMYT